MTLSDAPEAQGRQTIAWVVANTHLPASESPKLDVELLLAHVLQKTRTYLHTWPEKILTPAQWDEFLALVKRRRQGEPVAFLLGYQDFWNLRLRVSPCTLIPRPDTERLVEVAQEKAAAKENSSGKILDLGTGTGAIALALAKELPCWQVTGTDQSPAAVILAGENASLNQVSNASFLISDWFDQLVAESFDLIVSNPPYIDPLDPHLTQGDVRFEPSSALIAGNKGLADIERIVEEAPHWLASGGWLLLEHGYDQASSVRALLTARGFVQVESWQDYGGNDRVSGGCWCSMQGEVS